MTALARDKSDDDTPIQPVETTELFGHEAAEAAFLNAFNAGRLHHAWLITGPKGVGKATLAYRMARFLLAQPADEGGPSLFGDALAPVQPATLALAPDHPLIHRIAVQGHGDLVTIERQYDDKKKALKTEIVVGDVRRLQGFYGKTAAEGGWRVVIIDAADEMNRNAANALLKVLEEPPAKSILILVAHAPGRLLPTIRSRCRQLGLSTLDDEAVAAVLRAQMPELEAGDSSALVRLASGAPGRALSFAREGGLEAYQALLGGLHAASSGRNGELHSLASKLAPKKAETQYRFFMTFLHGWLARLIRFQATGERETGIDAAETDLMTTFAAAQGLEQWLELWEKVAELGARADAIHLDRKQVILILMMQMQSAFAR